jgi:hypothetical protein
MRKRVHALFQDNPSSTKQEMLGKQRSESTKTIIKNRNELCYCTEKKEKETTFSKQSIHEREEGGVLNSKFQVKETSRISSDAL